MIIIFILSLSTFAVDDFNRFDGNYQTRSIKTEFGLFNTNTSIEESKDTKVIGSFNQPLVSDLDNDGINEILVADSDTLYIYNVDSSLNLQIQSSYIFTGSSSSITPAVFYDKDGDGLKEIVGVWDDYFYLLEYDSGREFNKLSIRDKRHLGRIPATNMFCDTENLYSNDLYCFIPSLDGYIQQIRVTTPFELSKWDSFNEPEGDDIPDNKVRFVGENNNDIPINSEIIIRNNIAGNIDEIRLIIDEVKDNPQNANFIYDIYICEWNESYLTSNSVGNNCVGGSTLIGNDIPISQIFGGTTGLKTINLTPYFLEASTNYTLRFVWQSGSVIDNSDDYYAIETDSAPSNNLYKFSSGATIEVSSVIPSLTLVGSSVVEIWDETDICPSSSECLTTNPLQPPQLVRDLNDGSYKLVLLHDLNNDANEGFALIDIDTLSFDTQFGTLGYGDAIQSAEDIEGFFISDIDGGTEDIIFHFRKDDNTYISAINIKGTRVIASNYRIGTDCGGTGESRGSMPTLYDDKIVCAFARCQNSANSYTELICYDLETGSRLIDHKSPVGATWHNEYIGRVGSPIYSAYMSLNNPIYSGTKQIVAQRGIFYINFTSGDLDFFNTIAPMTNGDTPNNIHTISVVDANSDGSLDILGVRLGGISGDEFYFSSTTEENNPPLLDNNLAYGGFGSEYGTNSPKVCLGTTINFFAKEKPIFSNGNYINDLPLDNERIVSNCGKDTDGNPTIDCTNYLINGDFSPNNPNYYCQFNKTGTYRVRLFLQDSANIDDLTQFNQDIINVIVINGTPNIDCNILSDYQDTSEITTGINGTAVGTPCTYNSECITNNCEYGVCSKKAGLQRCNNDFECLSEKCTNGKCEKVGFWEQVEYAKNVQYGDDTDSNNFISLLISFGIIILVIAGSRGSLVGIVAGLALGFGAMAFFTMVGWLSAWIFFAVLIGIILLAFLVAIIFKGHE